MDVRMNTKSNEEHDKRTRQDRKKDLHSCIRCDWFCDVLRVL